MRCRFLTPSSTLWWHDAEPMISKGVTWSDRQSCIYWVNHTTHLAGQRRKQQLNLVEGWTEWVLLCAFVIRCSFCFSILTINTLQLVVEVVISCIYSEYMTCLYKSRAVHNILLYFYRVKTRTDFKMSRIKQCSVTIDTPFICSYKP